MSAETPIKVPSVGSTISTKAKTLDLWFRDTVTQVGGDHIVVGTGLGTRVFCISDYGRTWRW